MTVGVALITHNARHHLPYCLPPLINSPLKPRILLVNSSSTDGTVDLARQFGIETLTIPRKEFNHGATRELARKHLNCDIIVMVTPDAYALDSGVLERLVHPIQNGSAAIAYARQLPHQNAPFFESFPRQFNYPERPELRSIQDVSKYGVYTFFCSDSFAAYSNNALDSIGGFKPVLTGEDTVACAELLHAGHKIAYAAEAVVRHSHNYTLLQEFKRHFDTGLARKSYGSLIAAGGKDETRGKRYVLELFTQVAKEHPHLLPYAFCQTAAKWCGYKLGKASINAPLFWKKLCSSQDFYWNSVHFTND